MAVTTAAVIGAGASAASAASGLFGGDSGTGTQNGLPPGYIKPTVTAAEANRLNARMMKEINKAIRKHNRQQMKREQRRHKLYRQDIEWYRGQIDKASQIADPYLKERAKWMAKMDALMADPTEFLKQSPEMKAQMAGGLEALTSSLASKGLLGSGNMVIEAQRLGQREASTQLDKDWQRLAKLSGLLDADPSAAAQIAGGALVPKAQLYNPQFMNEQIIPAQFEQGRQYDTYQPGPPNTTRQAFADLAGAAGILGGYAGGSRRAPSNEVE